MLKKDDAPSLANKVVHTAIFALLHKAQYMCMLFTCYPCFGQSQDHDSLTDETKLVSSIPPGFIIMNNKKLSPFHSFTTMNNDVCDERLPQKIKPS